MHTEIHYSIINFETIIKTFKKNIPNEKEFIEFCFSQNKFKDLINTDILDDRTFSEFRVYLSNFLL